jgi:hypothetical protein
MEGGTLSGLSTAAQRRVARATARRERGRTCIGICSAPAAATSRVSNAGTPDDDTVRRSQTALAS